MNWLAEKDETIFLGQGMESGTFMSSTLKNVPDNKKLEFPVCEAFQAQFTLGLTIDGLIPISIFPRLSFLLLALGEIVNVWDKLPLFSSYQPKVIVRSAVGTSKPISPGIQHLNNYSMGIKSMLSTINLIELTQKNLIFDSYRRAYEGDRTSIVVEMGDLYSS